MSYWADFFFELLLGLPNPLMPNKMHHLYQTNKPVLNQRATYWVVTFISGDHDQTTHSVLSDLGLYCVPITQRKALGLYEFTLF